MTMNTNTKQNLDQVNTLEKSEEEMKEILDTLYQKKGTQSEQEQAMSDLLKYLNRNKK